MRRGGGRPAKRVGGARSMRLFVTSADNDLRESPGFNDDAPELASPVPGMVPHDNDVPAPPRPIRMQLLNVRNDDDDDDEHERKFDSDSEREDDGPANPALANTSTLAGRRRRLGPLRVAVDHLGDAAEAPLTPRVHYAPDTCIRKMEETGVAAFAHSCLSFSEETTKAMSMAAFTLGLACISLDGPTRSALSTTEQMGAQPKPMVTARKSGKHWPYFNNYPLPREEDGHHYLGSFKREELTEELLDKVRAAQEKGSCTQACLEYFEAQYREYAIELQQEPSTRPRMISLPQDFFEPVVKADIGLMAAPHIVGEKEFNRPGADQKQAIADLEAAGLPALAVGASYFTNPALNDKYAEHRDQLGARYRVVFRFTPIADLDPNTLDSFIGRDARRYHVESALQPLDGAGNPILIDNTAFSQVFALTNEHRFDAALGAAPEQGHSIELPVSGDVDLQGLAIPAFLNRNVSLANAKAIAKYSDELCHYYDNGANTGCFASCKKPKLRLDGTEQDVNAGDIKTNRDVVEKCVGDRVYQVDLMLHDGVELEAATAALADQQRLTTLYIARVLEQLCHPHGEPAEEDDRRAQLLKQMLSAVKLSDDGELLVQNVKSNIDQDPAARIAYYFAHAQAIVNDFLLNKPKGIGIVLPVLPLFAHLHSFLLQEKFRDLLQRRRDELLANDDDRVGAYNHKFIERFVRALPGLKVIQHGSNNMYSLGLDPETGEVKRSVKVNYRIDDCFLTAPKSDFCPWDELPSLAEFVADRVDGDEAAGIAGQALTDWLLQRGMHFFVKGDDEQPAYMMSWVRGPESGRGLAVANRNVAAPSRRQGHHVRQVSGTPVTPVKLPSGSLTPTRYGQQHRRTRSSAVSAFDERRAHTPRFSFGEHRRVSTLGGHEVAKAGVFKTSFSSSDADSGVQSTKAHKVRPAKQPGRCVIL